MESFRRHMKRPYANRKGHEVWMKIISPLAEVNGSFWLLPKAPGSSVDGEAYLKSPDRESKSAHVTWQNIHLDCQLSPSASRKATCLHLHGCLLLSRWSYYRRARSLWFPAPPSPSLTSAYPSSPLFSLLDRFHHVTHHYHRHHLVSHPASVTLTATRGVLAVHC